MMTIFIKWTELEEFKQIVEDNNIRHGPFRKNSIYDDDVGYYIDILDAGPIETYFRLKYADLTT